MEFKILKLSFKNFKGGTFVFEPDGKSVGVFGANETGKTRLFDANNWLFTNKDSKGKDRFKVKPQDKEGYDLPKKDVEVEGVYLLDDEEITIKKVYKESYTKKKKEFKGNVAEFFIDDVPLTKTKFNARLKDLFDEDLFKMLTNPFVFPMKHWKEKADILVALCPDFDVDEIFNSSKAFLSLKENMAGKTIEDYQAMVESRYKSNEKEKDGIPAKIEGFQELIDEAESIEVDDTVKEDLKTRLNTVEKELADIDSNEALVNKRKQLTIIETAILEKAATAGKGKADQINELVVTRNGYAAAIPGLQGTIQRNEQSILHIEAEINENSVKKTELLEKWHELHGQKPPTEDKTCPTCKQAFPLEMLNEMVREFNLKKADDLKGINVVGKGLEERNIKLLTAIDELKKESGSVLLRLQEAEKSYKNLDAQIKKLEEAEDPTSEEINVLLEEKKQLKADIAGLVDGSSDITISLIEERDSLRAKLDRIIEKSANKKSAKDVQKKIDSLLKEEKILAKVSESLEKEIDLVAKFKTARMEILEKEINSKFKVAKFKMFEKQADGNIVECCKIMKDGVPFDEGMNSGTQIVVGLDIINTLSRFYNFYPFVFIDNSESITQDIDIDAQQIRLYADKDYDKLTITESIKEV